MFKVDEEQDLSYISSDITVIESNYTIQPDDLLEIRVYTNKGERIIDPNYELEIPQNQNGREEDKPNFLVLDNGLVKFPMIGQIKIAGMNINEAEQYLAKKYDEYYKDAFVTLKYLNKRVVVLGAPGGQVIPLNNENTSIIEVVALAGGIDREGKAYNLRLIRGDLHKPQIFLIDLSTIEGMRNSMMDAMPGDIIYIEPRVQPITEGAKDFLTVFSIFVSAITLYFLAVNINK